MRHASTFQWYVLLIRKKCYKKKFYRPNSIKMKRKRSSSTQTSSKKPRTLVKATIPRSNNLLRGTPEIKSFDVNFTLNTAATWGFIHLANMAQGTAIDNRIGQRVRVISVDVRSIWNLDSQAPNAVVLYGDIGRAVLIQDTQSNGQVVAGLDVFTSNEMNQFQNPETNTRFIKLQDSITEQMSMNSIGTAVTNISYISQNLHYSYNQINIEYNTQTGTYQTVNKNGIWYGGVSANGSSFVRACARLRYVDY